MKRTRIERIPFALPRELEKFVSGAEIYDSSCSPEARVYYIDREGGYYLKRAERKTLFDEAAMTEYFHGKGLAPATLGYYSEDADWLLTERARGEDCTHSDYISDPRRLASLMGERLRALHELDFSDCPKKGILRDYLRCAYENYKLDNYDKSHFPDSFGYRSAEEAFAVFQEGKNLLREDTLIHGDFCLPNIMFDGWDRYSFIDLGAAGVSDRHIDLFWGAWTLWFNLGTNNYREIFFDAYGKDKIEPYLIKVVAAAEVFH